MVGLRDLFRPRRETIYAPATATARGAIERQTKATVWLVTNGRCWWCGAVTNPFLDWQIDHIQPLAHGGADALSNMVPSCAACNRRKSDRLPGDWIASLRGGSWYEHNPKAIMQRDDVLKRMELQ